MKTKFFVKTIRSLAVAIITAAMCVLPLSCKQGTTPPTPATDVPAKNSDTSLSALTLSAGSLSPVFSKATKSYGVTLPNATTGITVTATTSGTNATLAVRVNAGTYATVASGTPSQTLALDVGENSIDIQVTAENGSKSTYTVSVTRELPALTLQLDFAYGTDGNTSGSNVYVAWVEDMSGNVIQNLVICNRVLGIGKTLTNTALPFWKTYRYNAQQVALDAVTGATIAKQDFSVSRAYKSTSIAKFKVCFETDRSFDINDWFTDQPALLYSAIVDLANPQASYPLTLEAWTPNEGTKDTLSAYNMGSLGVGVRQTILGFITNKKNPSTPPAYSFGDVDTAQSSTCFVKSITLTIK